MTADFPEDAKDVGLKSVDALSFVSTTSSHVGDREMIRESFVKSDGRVLIVFRYRSESATHDRISGDDV